MDLSRIRRIVRSRWWVVLAVALLGAGGAVWFANYTNGNTEPRWGASAVVEFILPELEEGAPSRASAEGSPAMIEVIENALPVAEEANAALLEQPGFLIEDAANAGTLTFLSQAPSQEAAISIATEMRDNYIAVDPTAVDVEGSIEALITEADELETLLADLADKAPVVEPEPPLTAEQTAQLSVIDSQIATVLANVSELEDDLTFETDEDDIADIEEELDQVRARLVTLNEQRNDIDPPQSDPVPGATDNGGTGQEDLSYLTPEEQLAKSAAETRLLEIDGEYTDLLATDTSLTARYNLAEVTTQDLTPAPIPTLLAGAIGLLAGALIGLGGLIFAGRLKGTVWVARDMETMPLLAEVPQRRARSGKGAAAREQGVQAVRSAMLGIAQLGGPTTIGFTGLGAPDEGVSDLVLEVARSLAGVGRSVLLVDGQIGGNPVHRNLTTGGSTLADLDTQSTDDTKVALGVVGVIDGCAEIAPHLWILPGDPAHVDPVDVLASKAFRELTDQATRRFDIVMVVGPSALSPFAYVMAGTVSAYVVVAMVGKTRQSHVEQLARQFAGSRSRLVGVVLLGTRARRGYDPATDLGVAPPLEPGAAVKPAQVDEGEHSLLERLGESLAAMGGDDADRR